MPFALYLSLLYCHASLMYTFYLSVAREGWVAPRTLEDGSARKRYGKAHYAPYSSFSTWQSYWQLHVPDRAAPQIVQGFRF